MDGICVRIGAMRCHSQALTIKLKRDVPLPEIEAFLRQPTVGESASEYTRVKPPRAYAGEHLGTLEVPIGRLRKLPMGGNYLCAFTVGDQLLWGAAEPLRRMLRILRER